MSEHDTHHEHGGGHELDVMPNRRLFNLLTSLTALTLLACIGLVAFFYRQAETLVVERAKEGSFLVKRYKEEMREVIEGYGPTGDGEHFFVPHEKAKELVLSDPSRFRAAPPPPGWIHPDDLQGGAKGAAPKAQPAGTATPAPADGGAGTPEPGGAPAGEGAAAAGKAGEEKGAKAPAGASPPGTKAEPAAKDAPPKGGEPAGAARAGTSSEPKAESAGSKQDAGEKP